ALDLAVTDPAQRDPTDSVAPADSSRFVTQTGPLRVNGTQDWLDVELKNQREHALRMAQLIRRTSPTLFQSPEVQLSLASLLRQCNLRELPEDKGSRPNAGLKKDPIAANLSLHLDIPTQKTVGCANTPSRPNLDALI